MWPFFGWGEFPLCPLSGEFLSLMDVKFYQKSFFFFFLYICWDDRVDLILQFVNVLVAYIACICIYWTIGASLVVQRVKNLPATPETQEMQVWSWSERSPREGNGKQLWYSCLKNSMNRGSSCSTVHGVTKSWTWLSHWIWHWKNYGVPGIDSTWLWSVLL